MAQTATPFTQFWDALNSTMHAQCLPELTYGIARDLWTTATMEATKEARIIQRRSNRAGRFPALPDLPNGISMAEATAYNSADYTRDYPNA